MAYVLIFLLKSPEPVKYNIEDAYCSFCIYLSFFIDISFTFLSFKKSLFWYFSKFFDYFRILIFHNVVYFCFSLLRSSLLDLKLLKSFIFLKIIADLKIYILIAKRIQGYFNTPVFKNWAWIHSRRPHHISQWLLVAENDIWNHILPVDVR